MQTDSSNCQSANSGSPAC